MRWLFTLFFCGIGLFAKAQTWSIPAKSGDMQFADIVYLETVYHSPNKAKTDTLPGTGFLLTQDSIVYLVTTKRHLQSVIGSKEHQQIASALRIGTGKDHMQAISFARLHKNRSYISSSDNQDIAIISFKHSDKNVLDLLLASGSKPIAVDSLNVNEHAKDDSFFLPAYGSFYDNWVRHVSAGLSPGKITQYSNDASTFLIDHYAFVSFNGAPIFKDDKIIGMMIHPEGLNTTEAFFKSPYQEAKKSAVVVKAKIILQLLRKLQQEDGNYSLGTRHKTLTKFYR